MIHPSKSSSSQKQPRTLASRLRDLMEPVTARSDPELRRARMLAWLLFVLITLDFFSLILALFDETARGDYAILILLLNSGLMLAFYLNRNGHYKRAAYLTIFCAAIGPWAPIVFDPTILNGNYVPMVYLGFSVLLSGVLLSTRETVWVASAQFVGLGFIGIVSNSQSPINWPSLLTYILFTAALSFVISHLQKNDREQIEVQTRLLLQNQKQLQSILDNSASPIYVKDTRGRYLLVNHEFEVLFHILRSNVIGRTTFDLFPKELAELYWASDLTVLHTGIPLKVEEVTESEGETTIFLTHKFPLNDPDGVPYAVCSLATDITQLKQGEEELRQQSVRDPLTGLYNRRYLEETLAREITRASRIQKSLGIIMLDLDHFKYYNDSFGHAAGDFLLRKLGSLLEHHVRGSDIACRYGGDEFILIMPEATREVTCQRAELIRNEFKILRMNEEMDRGDVTLSLGVAVYPVNGIVGDVVLKAADAALYRAKINGRDRVVVAE
jgi:diguanylate cyclase (GGDEF)-like protein/PAS domain S-box-containing protein